LTEADIQPQLTRRRPGQSRLTTPRAEKDLVTIMSGTEFGHTLGTPIGLFVPNEDQRPGDYSEMNKIPRPGHADFTYQVKYGTRASSGGGRSSARETIGRVAAGAIAEKWLKETYGTEISCWVSSIGSVVMPDDAVPLSQGSRGWSREEVDEVGTLRMLRNPKHWHELSESEEPDEVARKKAQIALENSAEDAFLAQMAASSKKEKDELAGMPCYQDHENKCYNFDGKVVATPKNLDKWLTDELLPLRCPHPPTACKMASLIRQVKSEKDSIGGTVACVCRNVPPALGEPVFDRLEAIMAHAMLSLPATKGFEFGSGFGGTVMRGSEHNDMFTSKGADSSGSAITTTTNFAGGTLGGISSGSDVYFRVAVKPVSTIGRAQTTSTFDGKEVVLEAKGRHDPCVLPRTPPLVEGMAALVLADAALIQRTRLGGSNTMVTDARTDFVPDANGASVGASKRQRTD
jgi:chorismate synthase